MIKCCVRSLHMQNWSCKCYRGSHLVGWCVISEGYIWSITHCLIYHIKHHSFFKISQATFSITGHLNWAYFVSLMMKVESIQYQAALAVTGTWKGSNRVKLYEELGWESLSDRRRILQIHKIVDNKAPLYLRNKLAPNRRNLVELPYIFQKTMSRTSRYSHSFFPDAIKSWNGIISQFENFPTFQCLKSHITSLIRPVASSVFYLFDPTNTDTSFNCALVLVNWEPTKRGIILLILPLTCACASKVKKTLVIFCYSVPFIQRWGMFCLNLQTYIWSYN